MSKHRRAAKIDKNQPEILLPPSPEYVDFDPQLEDVGVTDTSKYELDTHGSVQQLKFFNC